ncbi:MAG TPA: hypothetical protein VM534_09080 [Thermoanaerobaculia bacterium]|nr:hypothetical protein [Thermoanaerobaculia bacterium]
MPGHLIHIGYAKTGSTFLRRWFSLHPQLAYVAGGIAGFRDVAQIAREGSLPGADVRYRVTSSESLSYPHPYVGQPLERYDYTRWSDSRGIARVCTTLAEIFPAASVLLVTRGFRSMILSAYSQYARTGGHLDFPPFCEWLQERVSGGDPAFDYDFLTGLYRRAFGEGKLIVVPYELLQEEPAAFTAAIESRLGLESGPLPPKALNVSLSPVELHWYPRIARLIQALPAGWLLRRLYLSGTVANRFRLPVALLERMVGGAQRPPWTVPDRLVEVFRGKASTLRDGDLYRPYGDEYLF